MIAIVLAAALATLQPCEVRNVKAQCSTVTVPENRRIEGGRTIDLNVVVIERSDKPDAIFMLAGGPGVAATNMAGFASRTFAGTDHDIVLVDIRGTGKSNALRCTMPGSDADPAGYFGDFLDLDALAKCRKELELRADLTQYTTAAIAADIEHVRRRLGYRQMNLYGTSYGTRLAIELMRRYPRSIRSVILDGVVPPAMVIPSTMAADADRSLNMLFALCRNDAACNTAFPNLAQEWAKVLKDAEDGVELTAPVKVTVNRGLFGEIIRNFLYSPEVYVKLPLAIHQAARGDWSVFADMAIRYTRNIRGLEYGLFLSVTCAQDIPLLDVARARAAANGTLLGSYRIDQQIAACRMWPGGAVDRDATRPLRSDIPTLIVSGELDPVTPPHHGDEVMRTLGRAKHIVIPNGSHSGDTGGCQEQVLSEFVREGSVAELDTTCVAKIQRPPFANATTSGKN